MSWWRLIKTAYAPSWWVLPDGSTINAKSSHVTDGWSHILATEPGPHGVEPMYAEDYREFAKRGWVRIQESAVMLFRWPIPQRQAQAIVDLLTSQRNSDGKIWVEQKYIGNAFVMLDIDKPTYVMNVLTGRVTFDDARSKSGLEHIT